MLVIQSKQSYTYNKKRPAENTSVCFSCRSCPDCNVKTICQSINYLEIKIKILNIPHIGQNFYYLIDDSVIISADSDSYDDPQSIPLFQLKTHRVNFTKK